MSDILAGLPEKLTLQEELTATSEDLILHSTKEAFRYGKICYPVLEDGEVLSAAYEGLVAASKRFRRGGISFFRYAKPYVRGALNHLWRNRATGEQKAGVSLAIDNARLLRDGGDVPSHLTYDGDPNTLHKPPANDADTFVSPEFDSMDTKERWASIFPTVEKVLTPQQKLILQLRYVGDLNLREIGDLLGMSRSSAHYCHRVALKKIRVALMEENRFKR